MKMVPVYVTFDIDNGMGPNRFTRKFDNSESALAYLGGYLGGGSGTVSGFHVDFLWEEN